MQFQNNAINCLDKPSENLIECFEEISAIIHYFVLAPLIDKTRLKDDNDQIKIIQI